MKPSSRHPLIIGPALAAFMAATRYFPGYVESMAFYIGIAVLTHIAVSAMAPRLRRLGAE